MRKQSNRKNEHVSLSENFYSEATSSLTDVHFIHHSLPDMDLAEVDLSTQLGNLEFSLPFFVNAMTGGSDWTGKLNQKLAIVARETGLAMATGSISTALRNPDQTDSYSIVRKENPEGLVFANLGAGHGAENAKRAVDIVEADAIQIHLNAPQELVMPEGDRKFSSWIKNIEEIVENVEQPLIVKEVGFGMSRETIQLLESIGVKYIDISGKGGTNFAKIENFRRQEQKLDGLESWGQSTSFSLLEAMEVKKESNIIASGGIRSAQDIVKSLAIGASLVGISSEFMHLIIKDLDAGIKQVQQWKMEIARTMTLLGAHNIEGLKKSDLIIQGKTAEWANLRNIDLKKYANR
ncbi:MAG: type 2 isopentenyl-diphosphate Delta-isomerase [Atopostipes sp.]|nr:type 2 isopentenyl-diphosphate Delta-isomerase [Atopostipes sp.]